MLSHCSYNLIKDEFMMKKLLPLSLLFLTACSTATSVETNSSSLNAKTSMETLSKLNVNNTCSQQGVVLQVLGSGGPELTDQRASTSYLLWVDGQSKVLIDAGAGSALHFEKAGGSYSDLDMILLSHLHVDHSADLPAYLKGSFFTKRESTLDVIGPAGNNRMPATDQYINRLFKVNAGAYQYLGNFLPQESAEQKSSYTFKGQVYQQALTSSTGIKVKAVSVIHGPIPALAWRIDVLDKALVFSGDMSKGGQDFIQLLDSADLFIAHNAIPEEAGSAAKNLHMTPKQIGQYAKRGKVKSLLLSHRMSRTLGNETVTLSEVKENYNGVTTFANDFDCIKL